MGRLAYRDDMYRACMRVPCPLTPEVRAALATRSTPLFGSYPMWLLPDASACAREDRVGSARVLYCQTSLIFKVNCTVKYGAV